MTIVWFLMTIVWFRRGKIEYDERYIECWKADIDLCHGNMNIDQADIKPDHEILIFTSLILFHISKYEIAKRKSYKILQKKTQLNQF